MADAGKSKCAICRHLIPQLKHKRRNSSRQNRLYSDWKKKCSESLCQVLLGSVARSFRQYFKTGEYCSSCLLTIRDINLTWSQLKCLEDRLNKLTHGVLQNLKTNYDAIEKKTNPGIVEDSKTFLKKYSNDERIEIIYSVASKRAGTLIFPEVQIKEDVQSFSESENEEKLIPVTIKVEEGDKVEYMDQGDDCLMDDFAGPSESVSADNALNGETMSEEKQPIRLRIRKNEVKYDNESSEVPSSGDEYGSDQEFGIQDEFIQSGCQSDDSLNAQQSPITNKRSINASKSPTHKQNKKYNYYKKKGRILNSPTVKCPTCNKTMNRTSLLRHQRTHTGEKPFVCSECGQAFSEKPSLLKHLKRIHGKLNSYVKKIILPEMEIDAASELASRKRRYYCDLCSWNFNYKYRYLRHLKDNHLNKDVNDGDSFFFHYCDVDSCVASFTSLTSLSSHCLDSHSASLVNNTALECNLCKRMFVQENNLQTHLKSHEENNFGCDFCHLTFSSQEELKDHRHRHEVQFKMSDYCYKCKDCGEGFTDIKMLTKHCRMHKEIDKGKVIRRRGMLKKHKLHEETGEKKRVGSTTIKENCSKSKFICKICQKAIHNSTVKSHMYTHTHPDGFKCSICPEVKRTPELLNQHEEKDHQIFDNSGLKVKCNICQEKFSKDNLENHMKSHMHSDGFQCPHCPEKQKSLKFLQLHLKRVHPADLLDLPPKFITNSYKTKCVICDKDFMRNSLFRKHVVEYHPEDYEATHPHICRLCWRVFRTEEERKFHVEKTHDYKCSVENCGKIFSSRPRLISHLNIHYKQKPYECPYCGKGFAQDGNCRSHVNMVHTKHRTFRCKLCPNNEGYYVRKEFNRHVQNTHPEIPEEDYPSALDYRKPAPVKLIVNSVSESYLECPALKRQNKKPR